MAARDTNEPKSERPRLAIVGCGTVAERFHGPALRGFDGFSPLLMVDRQPERAELLARCFAGASAESDFRRLKDRVDAAIVSLPNHLNAPVSTELLNMRISVLVEKPAALNLEEARALVAAATCGPAKLAVGFIRREAVAVRMAKYCLDSGLLGEIQSFSVEDGYAFNWQAVSEFRFDKTRGGGILFDIGSHVLDMLCYWFGDIRVTSYRDDSKGGVDTNGFIEVEMGQGVPGTVELSWTRELRNSAKLIGTRGSLEIRWYTNEVKLSLADGRFLLGDRIMGDCQLIGGAETFPLMFLSQLQRWHASLRQDAATGKVMADASDALRNIELITQCQSIREELNLSWRNPPGLKTQ